MTRIVVSPYGGLELYRPAFEFVFVELPEVVRSRPEEADEPMPFIRSRKVRVQKSLRALAKMRATVTRRHSKPTMKRLEELAPVHPGEILLEDFMRPCGLSVAALARYLHVKPEVIKSVTDCKRSLSTDLALRVARYFGTSPDVWLKLQLRYDLETAGVLIASIESEIQPR